MDALHILALALLVPPASVVAWAAISAVLAVAAWLIRRREARRG
jgi:hypothetical protein